MPKSDVKNSAFIKTDWQQQLSQAISQPAELLKILNIETEQFPDFHLANDLFPLKVPHSYINKIKPGDINDPLLLQIMASQDELTGNQKFNKDPVGDLQAMPVPGLLHKYHGRVLLITTSVCAVHCRYCFRRHFPYQENLSARNEWQQAIQYIQKDNSIKEVILSGGDPLILSDDKLEHLIQQLETLPQLKRIRIHTRLPVVLPSRITDKLLSLLERTRLNVCLVIHANHAQEIAQDEKECLVKLSKVASLLNQSVLLKGINDTLEAQIALNEALFEARVLPYYLHMLDPVEGAVHFDVKENQALALMQQLRSHLPGYLVPRLVREIAGENSKLPVYEL